MEMPATLGSPAARQAMRRQAEEILERARTLEASQRLPLQDRAAELYRMAGSRSGALRAFGDAIDSLIECERWDAAIAHCRRVLRLYPEVVRARGTLAVLLAVRGDQGDAAVELSGYVAASRRAGTSELAVRRLRLVRPHLSAEPFAGAIDGALAALEATGPAPLSGGADLAAVLCADPQALARVELETGVETEDPDLPWLDTRLPRIH